MRWYIVVCVLTAVCSQSLNAQNQDALQSRYQPRLDAAVERGLVYLASQQLDNAAAQQLGISLKTLYNKLNSQPARKAA